jgi:cytochrome c oxidase subunit 2
MIEKWLWLPPLASEHGARVDELNLWVHLLMLVLFVGWSVYFLYVLYRFRASRNPLASYAGAKGKASNFVEGGVVLAEAVLLLGFSIPIWMERVEKFPDAQEATVVRVVGEQFAWNAHYPGPDGVFGRTDVGRIDLQTNPLGLDREDPHARDDVVLVGELVLPARKPAIIHLRSKDVIHSFFLPEMRIKQDAIPGMSIPVHFVPKYTTDEMRRRLGNDRFRYEIGCAQLCGLGHYRMRGFLTVLAPEEFDAWMAEKQRELAATAEESFWQ